METQVADHEEIMMRNKRTEQKVVQSIQKSKHAVDNMCTSIDVMVRELKYFLSNLPPAVDRKVKKARHKS